MKKYFINVSIMYNFWNLDFTVINKLDNWGKKYVPERDLIFRIFEMIKPEDVKVVIIGLEPYPQCCPVSKANYASGPAFMIKDECITIPLSLKNLFIELRSENQCPEMLSLLDIKKQVKNWINQGVFLTNATLTRGVENTYLDDHQMLWINFTIEFVTYISSMECPVVLLGDKAWNLEKYIDHNKIIKLNHPANRDKKFLGSKMFTKINNLLETPIIWYSRNYF